MQIESKLRPRRIQRFFAHSQSGFSEITVSRTRKAAGGGSPIRDKRREPSAAVYPRITLLIARGAGYTPPEVFI